ncbi:MAG: HesA/MoeB/ThiF family protein [Bacteroidales bacterium]|nr:HesA/MoeB/ThiF family protein [Bacteroidales bacterium]MBN2819766.1 HesA/MoeB/ThiF family protein [Bacteroidales bacterium]
MLNLIHKELYSRHLLITDFTEEDQQKLMNARILVIGVGGLGSPVLSYLAAAGIGNIGIVDYDKVSLSNLQRQMIYNRSDINKAKADIAAKRIRELNPDCFVEKYKREWNIDNATEILEKYEVLIDCSDNITCRITSDIISKSQGKPFVYGAVDGWEGQVSVFNYGNCGSYREAMNIQEKKPEKMNPVGVVGAVPGVAGSIMAAEVIKIILSKGVVLAGQMLHFSLHVNSWQVLSL